MSRENLCAACAKPIEDQFFLTAIGRHWHDDCLRCICCNCRLAELDCLELVVNAPLLQSIGASEWIMKAGQGVYHLQCFACQQCNSSRPHIHDQLPEPLPSAVAHSFVCESAGGGRAEEWPTHCPTISSCLESAQSELTSTTTTSHPGMEGGMTTPVIGDEDKPKRRTATPEMAATCMVDPCHKTIKVTNSSTTGMIRHLRSCHPEEYKIVQEARLHIWGKRPKKMSHTAADPRLGDVFSCSPQTLHGYEQRRKRQDCEQLSQTSILEWLQHSSAKHSVEAIIGNGNHTENARIAPWTSSQPNYLANFLQTIHKQNQLPFGGEPVKLEPVEDNEENLHQPRK
uniref:LIM zinc-binding domain-containing protein n=1 Tax=Ditylenchus dipsaci TaxID=166011 RepID=A0A915DDM9_9BILA